ncbi:uncharacterized protein LOC110722519 [Chenopodium quinoa]|uniref:uncharacterized protein LOC110722519 n=1 Tax=Chenopodium quinoa TaxID=63459 RepID=UPI000B790D7E|nr:uncharacterized protein LOC110722519 [Chenopodium quinoa]
MADSSKLHPATTVNNIKACIPVTLDYKGTQYNLCKTLFQLHCRANMVIDFIIPPPVDPSAKKPDQTAADLAFLQRLDDIVRQWIYGTISFDLFNTIANPDDKAVNAWKRLENFFHNNKSARALTLDAQFTNTKLDQFDGVKSYCSHLKALADSMKNVGDTVSDNRMALQLLKGLSEEYKPFRTSVRHLDPLPSFDALRSMLELEEQTNASDMSTQSRGGNSRNSGRKNKGKGGGGKGKTTTAGGAGRNTQQQQQPPQQQQRWGPASQQQQQPGQGRMMPPPWQYWNAGPWASPP